jgi:hypothetical protein
LRAKLRFSANAFAKWERLKQSTATRAMLRAIADERYGTDRCWRELAIHQKADIG